ncbi:unnamed protein product [Protopolystoma xenopodis]|uniref:Uncharacterized protein n=1 Tax=Protopolystoma xenopodis TaxID=117903 RepID=A0A448XBM6_9PLAT|nr:unnamed protein product [Protopolystoma xenopodis]
MHGDIQILTVDVSPASSVLPFSAPNLKSSETSKSISRPTFCRNGCASTPLFLLSPPFISYPLVSPSSQYTCLYSTYQELWHHHNCCLPGPIPFEWLISLGPPVRICLMGL